MFEPGDRVPGIGVVDSNHNGLPWPIVTDSNGKVSYLYGVVSVIADSRVYEKIISCDAMTGNKLSLKDVKLRIGNKSFDYGMRETNNIGRRYPNK